MGARHAERAAQPSWSASSLGRRLARLQRARSVWRASGVHRRVSAEDRPVAPAGSVVTIVCARPSGCESYGPHCRRRFWCQVPGNKSGRWVLSKV